MLFRSGVTSGHKVSQWRYCSSLLPLSCSAWRFRLHLSSRQFFTSRTRQAHRLLERILPIKSWSRLRFSPRLRSNDRMRRMNFQRPPSVPLHIVGKLALGILFLHSLPQGLQAESGRLTRLPVSQAFLPNKITLEIDARWAAGNGYRPVRCTITRPGGPATADRSPRIILEPSTRQYRHFQPQVEGLIELKRGQRSAQIDLYCPQSYWWNSIQVQMYEGSKELREMRRSTAGVIGGRTAWSEAVPSLLFVSSAAGRTTVQLAREKIGRASCRERV